MSGGMNQRVMIAMAIACNPKLLIADEPTTALDVTIQAQIMELLVKLQKERGMALVLISHDLAVVSEVAQRVAVMYAGEVIETNHVPDIFAAPHHPYTEALLAAIPEHNRGAVRLAALPGMVPGRDDRPERLSVRAALQVRGRRLLEGAACARADAGRRRRWRARCIKPLNLSGDANVHTMEAHDERSTRNAAPVGPCGRSRAGRRATGALLHGQARHVRVRAR